MFFDQYGNLMVNVALETAPGPTTSTAALTSVAASATSVQLLAANATRKDFSITNDGPNNLYIAFGQTPTATSYKYKLVPGAMYEPTSAVWLGVVNGIWDVAAGNARISEES